MELEVPDEAESAEAGAVTAEAAWSSESGAEAGKSGTPVGAMGSPRSPAVAPWSRPAALRGAAARGLCHSHARRGGARALPFHGLGEPALRPGRQHSPARGYGALSARPVLGSSGNTGDPQAGVGAALYPGSLWRERSPSRCMR